MATNTSYFASGRRGGRSSGDNEVEGNQRVEEDEDFSSGDSDGGGGKERGRNNQQNTFSNNNKQSMNWSTTKKHKRGRRGGGGRRFTPLDHHENGDYFRKTTAYDQCDPKDERFDQRENQFEKSTRKERENFDGNWEDLNRHERKMNNIAQTANNQGKNRRFEHNTQHQYRERPQLPQRTFCAVDDHHIDNKFSVRHRNNQRHMQVPNHIRNWDDASHNVKFLGHARPSFKCYTTGKTYEPSVQLIGTHWRPVVVSFMKAQDMIIDLKAYRFYINQRPASWDAVINMNQTADLKRNGGGSYVKWFTKEPTAETKMFQSQEKLVRRRKLRDAAEAYNKTVLERYKDDPAMVPHIKREQVNFSQRVERAETEGNIRDEKVGIVISNLMRNMTRIKKSHDKENKLVVSMSKSFRSAMLIEAGNRLLKKRPHTDLIGNVTIHIGERAVLDKDLEAMNLKLAIHTEQYHPDIHKKLVRLSRDEKVSRLIQDSLNLTKWADITDNEDALYTAKLEALTSIFEDVEAETIDADNVVVSVYIPIGNHPTLNSADKKGPNPATKRRNDQRRTRRSRRAAVRALKQDVPNVSDLTKRERKEMKISRLALQNEMHKVLERLDAIEENQQCGFYNNTPTAQTLTTTTTTSTTPQAVSTVAVSRDDDPKQGDVKAVDNSEYSDEERRKTMNEKYFTETQKEKTVPNPTQPSEISASSNLSVEQPQNTIALAVVSNNIVSETQVPEVANLVLTLPLSEALQRELDNLDVKDQVDDNSNEEAANDSSVEDSNLAFSSTTIIREVTMLPDQDLVSVLYEKYDDSKVLSNDKGHQAFSVFEKGCVSQEMLKAYPLAVPIDAPNYLPPLESSGIWHHQAFEGEDLNEWEIFRCADHKTFLTNSCYHPNGSRFLDFCIPVIMSPNCKFPTEGVLSFKSVRGYLFNIMNGDTTVLKLVCPIASVKQVTNDILTALDQCGIDAKQIRLFSNNTSIFNNSTLRSWRSGNYSRIIDIAARGCGGMRKAKTIAPLSAPIIEFFELTPEQKALADALQQRVVMPNNNTITTTQTSVSCPVEPIATVKAPTTITTPAPSKAEAGPRLATNVDVFFPTTNLDRIMDKEKAFVSRVHAAIDETTSFGRAASKAEMATPLTTLCCPKSVTIGAENFDDVVEAGLKMARFMHFNHILPAIPFYHCRLNVLPERKDDAIKILCSNVVWVDFVARLIIDTDQKRKLHGSNRWISKFMQDNNAVDPKYAGTRWWVNSMMEATLKFHKMIMSGSAPRGVYLATRVGCNDEEINNNINDMILEKLSSLFVGLLRGYKAGNSGANDSFYSAVGGVTHLKMMSVIAKKCMTKLLDKMTHSLNTKAALNSRPIDQTDFETWLRSFSNFCSLDQLFSNNKPVLSVLLNDPSFLYQHHVDIQNVDVHVMKFGQDVLISMKRGKNILHFMINVKLDDFRNFGDNALILLAKQATQLVLDGIPKAYLDIEDPGLSLNINPGESIALVSTTIVENLPQERDILNDLNELVQEKIDSNPDITLPDDDTRCFAAEKFVLQQLEKSSHDVDKILEVELCKRWDRHYRPKKVYSKYRAAADFGALRSNKNERQVQLDFNKQNYKERRKREIDERRTIMKKAPDELTKDEKGKKATFVHNEKCAIERRATRAEFTDLSPVELMIDDILNNNTTLVRIWQQERECDLNQLLIDCCAYMDGANDAFIYDLMLASPTFLLAAAQYNSEKKNKSLNDLQQYINTLGQSVDHGCPFWQMIFCNYQQSASGWAAACQSANNKAQHTYNGNEYRLNNTTPAVWTWTDEGIKYKADLSMTVLRPMIGRISDNFEGNGDVVTRFGARKINANSTNRYMTDDSFWIYTTNIYIDNAGADVIIDGGAGGGVLGRFIFYNNDMPNNQTPATLSVRGEKLAELMSSSSRALTSAPMQMDTYYSMTCNVFLLNGLMRDNAIIVDATLLSVKYWHFVYARRMRHVNFNCDHYTPGLTASYNNIPGEDYFNTNNPVTNAAGNYLNRWTGTILANGATPYAVSGEAFNIVSDIENWDRTLGSQLIIVDAALVLQYDPLLVLLAYGVLFASAPWSSLRFAHAIGVNRTVPTIANWANNIPTTQQVVQSVALCDRVGRLSNVGITGSPLITFLWPTNPGPVAATVAASLAKMYRSPAFTAAYVISAAAPGVTYPVGPIPPAIIGTPNMVQWNQLAIVADWQRSEQLANVVNALYSRLSEVLPLSDSSKHIEKMVAAWAVLPEPTFSEVVAAVANNNKYVKPIYGPTHKYFHPLLGDAQFPALDATFTRDNFPYGGLQPSGSFVPPPYNTINAYAAGLVAKAGIVITPTFANKNYFAAQFAMALFQMCECHDILMDSLSMAPATIQLEPFMELKEQFESGVLLDNIANAINADMLLGDINGSSVALSCRKFTFPSTHQQNGGNPANAAFYLYTPIGVGAAPAWTYAKTGHYQYRSFMCQQINYSSYTMARLTPNDYMKPIDWSINNKTIKLPQYDNSITPDGPFPVVGVNYYTAFSGNTEMMTVGNQGLQDTMNIFLSQFRFYNGNVVRNIGTRTAGTNPVALDQRTTFYRMYPKANFSRSTLYQQFGLSSYAAFGVCCLPRNYTNGILTILSPSDGLLLRADVFQVEPFQTYNLDVPPTYNNFIIAPARPLRIKAADRKPAKVSTTLN